MVVELKNDLYQGYDFKSLKYALQIITYQNRYDLIIDWAVFSKSNFYETLPSIEKEEYEALFNKSLIESFSSNYTIGKNSTSNTLGIDESIRFLIQPVSIILENGTNDKYFIEAIIKFFDKEKIVTKHLENGWIQFENSGGCTNIENFIKGKLESFANLAHANWKEKYQYIRCIAIFDSDKAYPTANEKPSYTKIKPFLNLNNIQFHILEKRAMENYLPDEIWSEIVTKPELQKWINAYLCLSANQKDFFDIYNGFPKIKEVASNKKARGRQNKQNRTHQHQLITKRDEIDVNIKQLYKSVSDTNFDILNKGFKLPDFKTEFPKNFESQKITKKSLNFRAGNNELQELYDKIKGLL